MYVVIALLVMGQAFTLYKLFGTQPTATTNQPSGVTNQPDLVGVVIGSADVGPSVGGTVTQVGNGTLQIKDDKGPTDNFTTNADTKVQLLGVYKDKATQQSELAAYNAQITALMKDPQANKAALAAMQMPSIRVITAGTLADLKVGDNVAVFTNGSSNTAALINIATNVPLPTNY